MSYEGGPGGGWGLQQGQYKDKICELPVTDVKLHKKCECCKLFALSCNKTPYKMIHFYMLSAQGYTRQKTIKTLHESRNKQSMVVLTR